MTGRSPEKPPLPRHAGSEKGLGLGERIELWEAFNSKLKEAGVPIDGPILSEFSAKFRELDGRLGDVHREEAGRKALAEIEALIDGIVGRRKRPAERPQRPTSGVATGVAPPVRVMGRSFPLWAPPIGPGYSEAGRWSRDMGELDPEEIPLFREYVKTKGLKMEEIEKLSAYHRGLRYYREFRRWLKGREIEPRQRETFRSWLQRHRGLTLEDFEYLPRDLKERIRTAFREFYELR